MAKVIGLWQESCGVIGHYSICFSSLYYSDPVAYKPGFPGPPGNLTINILY